MNGALENNACRLYYSRTGRFKPSKCIRAVIVTQRRPTSIRRSLPGFPGFFFHHSRKNVCTVAHVRLFKSFRDILLLPPHLSFKMGDGTAIQQFNSAKIPSNSQDSIKIAPTEMSLGSQMLEQHAVDQPKWIPWTLSESRVVAFQSLSDNALSPVIEFKDAESLDLHLRLSCNSQNVSSRFIYIMEGLSAGIAGIFQQHLRLHMALFKDHERLVPHGDRPTGEAGGIPFLPSAVPGRDYVTLKYHQPVVLSCRPDGFRNLCNISGRHIAMTRLLGKFSNVATLRRKCTFWSRRTESGGWICS